MTSEQIQASARNRKRRFLRQLKVRASDLDAMTNQLVSDWALARAMVDAATNDRTRIAAFNSASKARRELEARLAALELDRPNDHSDPWIQ